MNTREESFRKAWNELFDGQIEFFGNANSVKEVCGSHERLRRLAAIMVEEGRKLRDQRVKRLEKKLET